MTKSSGTSFRQELGTQCVVVIHGNHADEGDDRETNAVVYIGKSGDEGHLGQSSHDHVQNAGDGVGYGLEATRCSVDVSYLMGQVIVEDVDKA